MTCEALVIEEVDELGMLKSPTFVSIFLVCCGTKGVQSSTSAYLHSLCRCLKSSARQPSTLHVCRPVHGGVLVMLYSRCDAWSWCARGVLCRQPVLPSGRPGAHVSPHLGQRGRRQDGRPGQVSPGSYSVTLLTSSTPIQLPIVTFIAPIRLHAVQLWQRQRAERHTRPQI